MSRQYDQEARTRELRCIWMDAGVISYKLCDRNFECEGCPFDVALRKMRPDSEHGRTARTTDAGDGVNNTDEGPRRNLPTYVITSCLEQADVRSLPHDRAYHSGHTWAQERQGGAVRTGLDHIGAALLGTIPGVVLPSAGSRVSAHAPFAWIVQHEGTLALHAPVSGRVSLANAALLERPQHLADDPYDLGWIAEIIPDSSQHPPCLKSAEEIAQRYEHEIEALRLDLVKIIEETPRVGATMFDGGTHVEHLTDLIGRKAFLHMLAPLFRP